MREDGPLADLAVPVFGLSGCPVSSIAFRIPVFPSYRFSTGMVVLCHAWHLRLVVPWCVLVLLSPRSVGWGGGRVCSYAAAAGPRVSEERVAPAFGRFWEFC